MGPNVKGLVMVICLVPTGALFYMSATIVNGPDLIWAFPEDENGIVIDKLSLDYKQKEKAVVSLLGAVVPLPVTINLDNVKVIRREEGEEDDE